MGYPDKGLGIGNETLALAERLAHPLSHELALLWSVMLHLDRGEPESALELLAVAETLVAEQRLAFLLEPRFLRGAALSARGELEEAVGCVREGFTTPLGTVRFRPYGLAGLAEALVRQGEHRAALAAASEGLGAQEETGQRWWAAELHRLQGIALLGLNRVGEAQTALEKALRVARRQQAKSYELRAATSLARLRGEQGRRVEARELLAPVHGWFTEGFDTANIKNAAALLDELA